jgi:ABC-type sugar transport system ATPase subunit
MRMEPIITLKNLTKSYGETLAVDHVNLEVNKGEVSLYWTRYDVAKFRLKRAK